MTVLIYKEDGVLVPLVLCGAGETLCRSRYCLYISTRPATWHENCRVDTQESEALSLVQNSVPTCLLA